MLGGGNSSEKRPQDPESTIDTDATWTQTASLFTRPRAHGHKDRPYQYPNGHQIGKYWIESPLGRGAMGEVYEALDQETDRRVALKILPAQAVEDVERRARFLREGALAASIRHPHSLFIFGADEIEGVPCIAMELCTGGNLQELIDQNGALAHQQAVDFAIQVCQGLTAAHLAGVLHRDIKPANCFLTGQGDVIIGDYGLSVSTLDIDAARLTADGSFVGTPAFASPEQIRGQELDVRADIYSVGASLYYLLSGQTPFAGHSVQSLFAAILDQDPQSLAKAAPNTPPGLIKVIARCLAKDPANRYPDYAEMITDLERFGSRAPLPATPVRRIVAGMADIFLCQMVFHVVQAALPVRWLDNLVLGFLVIGLTGTIEGLKGLSPGKILLGTRVLDRHLSVPGLKRGLQRAAMFYLPVMCLDILDLAYSGLTNFFLVAFALVFVTARKRNAWSGIHDLRTNTQVVNRPVSQQRLVSMVPSELSGGTFDYRLGPYRIETEPSQVVAGTVLLGVDPQLQRKVWILVREIGASELPSARRDLSAPSHLRWLNSKRSATEAWDVYEALAGTPFLSVVTAAQSWDVVRGWLTDLVAGSVFLERSQASTDELTTRHLWVTTSGRLVWLDFVAPGAPTTIGLASPRSHARDLAGIEDLLFELGEIVADRSGHNIHPCYPLGFSLLQQRLKNKTIASMMELKSTVAELANKAGELTRAHRMKMMALLVFYPLFGAVPELLVTVTSNMYVAQAYRFYQWIIYPFFALMPLWVVLGIAFKGGVMYRFFGVAVVTRNGLEASPIRLVVRTLLVWSPIILTWVWLVIVNFGDDLAGSRWAGQRVGPIFYLVNQFTLAIQEYHPVPLVMFALLVVGGVWAIVCPGRGVHDRLVGTYLVRR